MSAAVKNDYVVLKITGLEGKVTRFGVKATTKMNKVKEKYAELKGVHVNLLRFLHDGRPIQDGDTVNSLDLFEDEICIEVYMQMLGGGQ